MFSDAHGLWSRISYYEHPNPGMPKITLLPMTHLGEAEFYSEMRDEMWTHDAVFLEGCYVPSGRIFHLIQRVLTALSGLSLQSGKISIFKRGPTEPAESGADGLREERRKYSCDCGTCYNLELRMVRADLHRFHAEKALRNMPFWNKAVLPFLLIFAVMCAPFINIRKGDFNDAPRDEGHSLFDRFMAPYKKFVMHDRDLFLRTVLAEEIVKTGNSGKTLCVKYGAGHMQILASTLLSDFNYVLHRQRDVLAIAAHKSMEFGRINTGYGVAHNSLWASESVTEPELSWSYIQHSPSGVRMADNTSRPLEISASPPRSGRYGGTTPRSVQIDFEYNSESQPV